MNEDRSEYTERTRVVHRSPAYPAIGLEEAVAKARIIWDKERSNRVALDVLAGHLGYKTAVGPGGVIISALMKFGLVADEGTGAARHARLTEHGRRIVLDSDDRSGLLKEAALLPTIHKELWTKYGAELPSPESMKRYLIVERRFNERVVDGFIQQYIDTLDYAGLRDTIEQDAGDKGSGGDREREEQRLPGGNRQPDRRPRERTGMTVLSFQISDRLVEVAVPGGPLTKSELGVLKDYLGIQERIAPDRVEPESKDTASSADE